MAPGGMAWAGGVVRGQPCALVGTVHVVAAALHRIEDALDGGARNVVELRETYGAANLVASYIRDCLVVGGEPVLLTDDGVQVLALSGSGNGLVTVTLRLVDGQLATEQRFARSLVIIT